MSGWKEGGADLFSGVTRSGKTTKAKRHQEEDVERFGIIPVILDLERGSDWAGVPHAESADEVIDFLYRKNQPPRVWTPRDEFERRKFFLTVAHWGRVACLVDGVPRICNEYKFETPFREALYAWGHGRMGTSVYYLTAQRFSQLNRDVFSACRKLYIFRQAPGADADRAWREYKIPQGNPKVPGSGTTALGVGEYYELELGIPQSPAVGASHPTGAASPSRGPVGKAPEAPPAPNPK